MTRISCPTRNVGSPHRRLKERLKRKQESRLARGLGHLGHVMTPRRRQFAKKCVIVAICHASHKARRLFRVLDNVTSDACNVNERTGVLMTIDSLKLCSYAAIRLKPEKSGRCALHQIWRWIRARLMLVSELSR